MALCTQPGNFMSGSFFDCEAVIRKETRGSCCCSRAETHGWCATLLFLISQHGRASDDTDSFTTTQNAALCAFEVPFRCRVMPCTETLKRTRCSAARIAEMPSMNVLREGLLYLLGDGFHATASLGQHNPSHV